MKQKNQLIERSQRIFLVENPADCHFDIECYAAGTTVCYDDLNTNYLIFCQSGYARITSTLFHDEILCAGEIMFVPCQCECVGIALSDVSLLVHKFNNTVCCSEKCILSFLYSHRHMDTKTYCCKLTAPDSLQALMNSIVSYINDQTHDASLWYLKHKELIWVFTRYFSIEELCSFFHPMIDNEIPFKSLVLAHYRKAEYTDTLAEMCGYQLHTFRRKFKEEFGTSAHKWLTLKRAELVQHRLSLDYLSFSDIITEFHFSSPQQFNRFCKDNLGDAPQNLRRKYADEANKADLSKNNN